MYPFNWNVFPFTKMNAVNLDWIMTKFRELVEKTDSVDAAVEAANEAADRAEEAAGTITGAVLYDRDQTLSGPEQQQARENIGAAATVDITPDAVLYNHAQTLTNTQRSQARDNIGAASSADAAGTVKYTVQALTPTQQSQARANIGAAASTQVIDAVLYDQVQSLTNAEKATARGNIDAAAVSDIPASPVLYSAQTLTDAEKAQARTNIGAEEAGTIPEGVILYDTAQTLSAADQQQARENIGIINYVKSKYTRGGISGITNTNPTDLTVLQHEVSYWANEDGSIILLTGHIGIELINSTYDQKIILTDIAAPAQAAARLVHKAGQAYRATSALANNAINTQNLTRIYATGCDIQIDTDGTISILVGSTTSGAAGNYLTYMIGPVLLMF